MCVSYSGSTCDFLFHIVLHIVQVPFYLALYFFCSASILMEVSLSQTPWKAAVINLNSLGGVYHSLPNHFAYFFFCFMLKLVLPCPSSFCKQHFFPKCTFCLLWFLLWLVIRDFQADGGGLLVLVLQPSLSF